MDPFEISDHADHLFGGSSFVFSSASIDTNKAHILWQESLVDMFKEETGIRVLTHAEDAEQWAEYRDTREWIW